MRDLTGFRKPTSVAGKGLEAGRWGGEVGDCHSDLRRRVSARLDEGSDSGR